MMTMNQVSGTSSASITHSTVSVSSKTVVHQYNEDHLSFVFISSGEQQPHPKCDEKLANQVMVSSKQKRQVHTNHSHLCENSAEYFKRLGADQIRLAIQWTKFATTSNKAEEASYTIAKIVAKKIKLHTIAESVILPACCRPVTLCLARNMKEILKNPYVG
jgi:uncharacterized protein (UPF0212 family)